MHLHLASQERKVANKQRKSGKKEGRKKKTDLRSPSLRRTTDQEEKDRKQGRDYDERRTGLLPYREKEDEERAGEIRRASRGWSRRQRKEEEKKKERQGEFVAAVLPCSGSELRRSLCAGKEEKTGER